MEITLGKYMENQKLTNMPLAKYHLLQFKKRGLVFFKEEVAELQLEEKFHLYYYLSANGKSEKDAFPVPKNSFLQATKSNDERFEEMKAHFESYYLNDELDKEGFDEFDLKNPYIGEDYVWVFKRTS
ncbi:hypothetical protein CN918_26705 [Priestia megaterium]|nr:hypothetical protein CN918_26705 [Priestia megaterium]